jgi:hypothetical protein
MEWNREWNEDVSASGWSYKALASQFRSLPQDLLPDFSDVQTGH